jgi:hypothetical protein
MLQYQYWSEFVSYLKDNNTILRVRNPLAQNWMDFSLGRSDAWLSANIYINKGSIWMGLCCQADCFGALHAQREIIQQEFGQELDWEGKPGRKSAYISLRKDADVKNRDKWPEQFAWLKDNLERLQQVIQQRVLAFEGSDEELPDQQP